MQSITGSTVTAQDGSKLDLKRIKIVPADSKDAHGRFAQNTAGPERKRRDNVLLANSEVVLNVIAHILHCG